MAQAKNNDATDIKHVDAALHMAAKLLGISNVTELVSQATDAVDLEQPRPQGLGLGAKHLPHNKAVASGLHSNLRKRLTSSTPTSHKDEWLEQPDQETDRKPRWPKRSRHQQKHQPLQEQGRDPHPEEEEEEVKGKAVAACSAAAKAVARKLPQATDGTAPLSFKQQLVLEQQNGRKKKKGKHRP